VRRLRPPTASRPFAAGIGGVAAVAGATSALVPLRSHLALATPALVLVVAVVLAAGFGGVRAALATAAAAAAAFNVAFIPPYGTFKVQAADDWVALGVFSAVAVLVGLLAAAQADRRREAEQRAEQLRAAYAELERERARADELADVDAQRRALLRSVSHDLRTPLATIRAIATDLRDAPGYDEATRAELLDSLCDEAERLDRLVANLLAMSRIEAGALKPERQAVPLDELLAERARRLRRLFLQVRLELDVPADLPLVDGDYTQLEQVFTNLLENAARYAPPRSTVRIRARPAGGMVEVAVADEGPGIADHERARIFEPFRRGEGSRSSGIGLAICKAIVEAHGGTIGVERTPGGGATFVVRLPVCRVAPPPPGVPVRRGGRP
jgi:two-component system sensor histidine kinase KdpD